MTSQEDLAALWLNAPEDRLCGREQAKAWALREVWRADGKGKHGMLTFIASKDLLGKLMQKHLAIRE